MEGEGVGLFGGGSLVMEHFPQEYIPGVYFSISLMPGENPFQEKNEIQGL